MTTRTIEITKQDFESKSELLEYDYEFLSKLEGMFDHSEGGLFNWRTAENMVHQLKFHKKYLQKIQPKYILEIGTFKGFYSYVVKKEIPEVKVYTFGINEESQLCVDAINELYGENFITFFPGDSLETLTSFDNPDDIPFDMAWVDGGHSYECAISDLVNCGKLGIENILIDDCDMGQVTAALRDFCNMVFSDNENDYSYSIKDYSPNERMITYLSREKIYENI